MDDLLNARLRSGRCNLIQDFVLKKNFVCVAAQDFMVAVRLKFFFENFFVCAPFILSVAAKRQFRGESIEARQASDCRLRLREEEYRRCRSL
ncbi:hypothetical protein [Sinorhizobium mexicanum]|uniref:Uncharacterized protein n=1 Tax=Sinorhizobium mexicanum TaxID=375549 RepID=A0A859QEP4_9HYPH|nr:hypothetical protein [Sinorhizobium mexicanum]MBP1881884.1 hypothetical protein [Sinorhizobium mexicanum]QLL61624.1 hypothetical protein FKV68_09280 [Sinorhizobium mexicanum]